MAEVKYAKAVNRDRKAALAASTLLLTQQQGYLEAEDGELTCKLTQERLKPLLPSYNASLMYDLALPFGPYSVDYTRNGANLVVAGRQGHIALMQWKKHKLLTEINVKETVKDVKFLHNELLFAVAQRKGVFIYDNQGIEVHCLSRHIDPKRLEFLPYHFLMVSANDYGFLKYLDVSTGKQVVEHRWNFQSIGDMKQNPWNAVMCVGDGRGVVSMWSPSTGKPLLRIVTHNGPVLGLAIDQRGLYMATTGSDTLLKIWDIRNPTDPLFEYRTSSPASALSMSQTGLLSVSNATQVTIYKDWHVEKQRLPYMRHSTQSAIHDLSFVPLEDFLGIGVESGFSSISVPGSGWANFDSYEANPFQTKKQRQEQEVHMLLEKLRPDTIMLNPHEIGVMDKAAPEVIRKEEIEEKAAAQAASKPAKKRKREEEAIKKHKNSVHDKKTRHKIQEAREVLMKPRVDEVDRVAKEINMLAAETAELGSLTGLISKRKKLGDK
jgi:U3 small nucleolar RNA-associated protein 7